MSNKSEQPDDCLFLYGTPRTREEFLNTAMNGTLGNFASGQIGLIYEDMKRSQWTRDEIDRVWSKLTEPQIGRYWLAVNTLGWAQEQGVHVRRVTSPESLASVPARPVVVLLTHCDEDKVELGGGMYSAKTVAAALHQLGQHPSQDPISTYDLTLCRSQKVHDALRAKVGPKPRIIYALKDVQSAYRMAALRLALDALRRTSSTYAACYADALHFLRNHSCPNSES